MLKFSFEWKKQIVACMKPSVPTWGVCGTHEISIFQTTSTKSPPPNDGYGDFTAVYGRDGKKLHGFAYRNHVMVDYRHKRDSVYKIYKKVWKNGWVSPYLLEDVHLPTHPND